MERKSGRLNDRETRDQLARERAGLQSGQLTQSTWETVAGEKISRTVTDDIRALARDFPGRFEHRVISRADAVRAIELGRSLVAKQGELIRAYELDRAERARKRLQNIREIVRKRSQERELDRKRREDRHRRAEERLPKVREAAVRLQLRREQQRREAREQKIRDASERVAREFGEVMKNIRRRDREANEARDARGARLHAELHELSVYAEQVQQAREAADAADHARLEEAAKAEERARLEREAKERARQQREQADAHLRSRLPPDVADLLLLGRPTPGLESPHREPPSAGSTRGGRTERSRARVREREGRGRGI
ncbi:hypothetical protein [Nocardia nova]|uniref:hypothetical protein n=1 Tax=Nocardia nova TaxID=37330 RepID=UPI002739FA43|nr:hypothetical protein [Nocardia nova]